MTAADSAISSGEANLPERALTGVSLLIVEDDAGILNMLRSFFISQGADVATEQSGRDVLTRVQAVDPDILILDVVLPFKDGFTILTELRHSGIMTPAIMLTDKSGVDDKVRGLSFGADDYMTKPFSTKELLARVKSVLRRTVEVKAGVDSEPLAIGSMIIHSLSREVRLADGEQLHLTKTEFDLLTCLGLGGGAVVPREVLLQDILGYKNDAETKALVMHIANLRKKLAEAEVSDVRIETVVGVGYKLIGLR